LLAIASYLGPVPLLEQEKGSLPGEKMMVGGSMGDKQCRASTTKARSKYEGTVFLLLNKCTVDHQ
jgi:hypothetical protein